MDTYLLIVKNDMNTHKIKILPISETQLADYEVIFWVKYPRTTWQYKVKFKSKYIFDKLMKKAKFSPGRVANLIKKEAVEAYLLL